MRLGAQRVAPEKTAAEARANNLSHRHSPRISLSGIVNVFMKYVSSMRQSQWSNAHF